MSIPDRFGCPTGIEPASLLPQSRALPLSYGHHTLATLTSKNRPSKEKHDENCAGSQNRTAYARLFQRRLGLYHHPASQAGLGVGRCLQEYCWDSPASLYTFRKTDALSGLARDCSSLRRSVPRIHPIFQSALLRKAPKSNYSGRRSTNELTRPTQSMHHESFFFNPHMVEHCMLY